MQRTPEHDVCEAERCLGHTTDPQRGLGVWSRLRKHHCWGHQMEFTLEGKKTATVQVQAQVQNDEGYLRLHLRERSKEGSHDS